MESIAVALLTRNEAGRYLPSALAAWSEWADAVAVLDNGTDHTLDLVESAFPDAYHYERYDEAAWGDEAPARARLWEMALEAGTDWIIVLDADMVPARDPTDLLHSDYDSIGFNLYDLWQEDPLAYRVDGLWKAHENWRVWAVRAAEEPAEGWKWSERGIHTGHFPWNVSLGRTLYAPCDYGLLHYAYARPEDRERKYLAYADTANQMSEREIRHAESILQPATVRSLPFEPDHRLVHEEDR